MSVGGLEIENRIDPEAEKVLVGGCLANARAKNAPPYEETPLQILRRDEAGAIVAGLTGKTFWNWLYIDTLWVAETLRGQGVGAGLVAAAEVEAVGRGCHSAYLWTESFEGPAFYPKLGYKEFVTQADCPNGYKRIGFMKKLRGAA